MDAMTNAAVTTDPIMLCRYCQQRPGVQQQRPRDCSARIWPFGPERVAHRMLHPGVRGDDEEAREPRPSNTMNAAHQCPLGPSRFSPNRNRPRKLDSRKNENTPSMASVWPMTPPAAFENGAQFVPN